MRSDPAVTFGPRLAAGLALAATLNALAAGAASAQTISSPYRLIETRQEGGLFVGHLNAGQGRFEYGPAPGTVFGGRYGIVVSGPITLEGVATYFPTTRDVIDPDRPEGDRAIGEADSNLVLLDARMKFSLTGPRTWHSFSPHFLAGGGVGFDVAGDQSEDLRVLQNDRFDFGTSFLGILGAGLRWIPSDRIEMRSDVHLTFWQLETPPGFSSVERDFTAVEENEWVSGVTITIGGAFRF